MEQRERDENSGGDEKAPDESAIGPAWWEGGSGPEEEPATGRGEAMEPAVDSAWWEDAAKPEEADDPYAGAPAVPSAEEDEPVDLTETVMTSEDPPAAAGVAEAWEAGEPAVTSHGWQGGPEPEAPIVEEPAARAPEDDDEPPAVPAAQEEEAQAPTIQPPPWWGEVATTPDAEPASEREASGAGPDATAFGEPVAEPQPRAPEDDDERAEEPAASEEPPAVPAAQEAEAQARVIGAPWWERGPKTEAPSGRETDAVEEQTREMPAPDRPEPPASPGSLPAAAEALPDGPPAGMIRSLVAEVCPDELLLVETAGTPLPEWAGAAVAAARDDLDQRLAQRRPVDASEYLRLAIVENAMGLDEEADGHLKEALPRSDGFGPVLNALAVTSLARGKIAPAIVYCKEALRETSGEGAVRAAAASNLGDLYDLQGNADQAVEAYETAIECLGAEGESRRLSRLHLRAGRAYRRLGRTDESRRRLSDAVRLSRESGDDAGYVRALVELGSASTESGLHEVALRDFEEAVRVCLRTGDKPGAALVQDALGVAYMAQDQLTRALAYFESALALHRELGNRKDEAVTLGNMGKIHDARGDADEARRLYEAAGEDGGQGYETRPPRADGDDPEGARARLRKAEEIFNRAGSAERQEDDRRMTASVDKD